MTSSFKSLRYTTAIAVSLVAISTANQANAQVVVSTPEVAQRVLADGDSLTVTNTGSVTTNASGDVNASVKLNVGDTSPFMLNDGTIENTNVMGVGLTLRAGSIMTGDVTNNGSILGGILGFSHNAAVAGDVINNGTIEGTSNGVGIRYQAYTAGALINNAGGMIIGGNASGQGVDFRAGDVQGGIINAGTIVADTGINVASSSDISGGVTNTGNISGQTSSGIEVSSSSDISGGIINDGTINALSPTGSGLIFNGTLMTGAVINNSGGTIAGGGGSGHGIQATSADLRGAIINAGSISGNTGVFLSSSSNISGGLTNTGTITGSVNAIGLGTSDISGGLTNSGMIIGENNGVAFTSSDISGGINNSGTISGTTKDGIIISFSSDVSGGVINSGAIEGAEHAIFVSGASSDLSGGLLNEATGSIIGDTDSSGAGFTGNNAIRVQGDISGGIDNRGLIQHNTITAIGVELDGDFTGDINNSGTITGAAGGIGIYKSSGGDFTGAIENSGIIHGGTDAGIAVAGSFGVDLVGGITNRSGGVISSDTGSGISVGSSQGNDISGGILNEAGGVITGGAAGIVVDTSSADISGGINNSGTISGTSGTGTGILAEGSADISGGITNNAGGTISGLREGILVGTSTDVSGAITNGGTISGGRGGIYLGGSNANISGALTNQASGVITGDIGIFVSSSSSISGGISNAGTIEGTDGTAIDLQSLSAATPITIAGGRIIGDVTDGNSAAGFSPVTVTGSGFKTEGDFTVSDLIVNAGQDFTISSDNTVSLNDMTASAGTLIYELGAASTAQLNVTGAGNDIDISASTIEVLNNGRAVGNGDSILIGTGTTAVNGGAGQALTAVTDNLTFFDLQVADGISGGVGANNEVYLLVSSASNPCSGQFSANPNGACGALGGVTDTTDPTLQRVIANIGGLDAEETLKATLPQVDGGSFTAAQNVTGNTLRLVSDRLTIIRDGGGASGISSGDITEDLQMWGQVFGQKINQGQRKGIAGYDAITRGLTIGADTEGLHDNATVGVAVAYANTDVKSNSANNTRSDIGSYNISLYGDYDLNADTYLIGDIGYTYGDNEATRFNVGGVTGVNADSDYGSHQVEARLIAARDYNPTQYEGVRVTPKVQAHYIRYQNEDITETGAGGAGLSIDSEALNILEFGVGVDVRKDYVQDDGAILSPEVSVGYRYDVIGDAIETTSTFSGGGPSFRTEGADPDQDTLNLGFGVGYTTPNNMEFTASYDYERKDEFNSNSAFIRIAAPF